MRRDTGFDRSRLADRFLEWKVRIFAVAAVLGLVGIYFEELWMTGGAIVMLAGAVLLRFLPGGGGGGPYGDADEAEEGDQDQPAPVDG